MLLCLLVLVVIPFGLLTAYWPREGLGDFGSFVASERAATRGMNPYAVYPQTFHVSLPAVGLEVDCPNLNAPASLLLFQPLASVDPQTGFAAWNLFSLALYALTLVLLVRADGGFASPLRVAWALGLAGLWHSLSLGQVYVPLLALCVGAWLLLRRQHGVLAGLLIGALAAIKPNFLVWPALLLLAGHWSVALAALASGAVLGVAPVVAYGPGVYPSWLQASASFAALGGIELPGNGSIPSVAARLHAPWLGVAVVVGLLLALAALAWRRRPSPLAISGLAIASSLLSSPITWTGYTLFLLPILFGRPWTLPIRVAAAILVVPFAAVKLGFQVSDWLYVVVGSLYVWAMLLVLAELVVELVRESLSQTRRLSRGSTAGRRSVPLS